MQDMSADDKLKHKKQGRKKENDFENIFVWSISGGFW